VPRLGIAPGTVSRWWVEGGILSGAAPGLQIAGWSGPGGLG